MLSWILNPGIELNTRDFELLEKLNRHDTLGEWGRPIQEIVDSGTPLLTLLLNLQLESVVFFFILFIKSGNGLVEPPFCERRVHDSPFHRLKGFRSLLSAEIDYPSDSFQVLFDSSCLLLHVCCFPLHHVLRIPQELVPQLVAFANGGLLS
jgi:hypothetical protein